MSSSSSILHTIQKRSFLPSMPSKDDLPISHATTSSNCSSNSPPSPEGGAIGLLRRRLSSISARIIPHTSPHLPLSSSSTSSSTTTWAFRRSRSMPSIIGKRLFAPPGEDSLVRRWWDWSWGWILSRKPTFARDLEMNDEETAMLGCHSRGSWRHVVYKFRSELRRIVAGGGAGGGKFAYDSFNYAQNFDDGGKGGRE